eukprot:TRINITY_DN2843_c0_g1_i2.p1 TRINITY_DN2843_c0_g1~~TRINITY_DN2843_c0_g1_i2.p1  ORF type:complete len:470 (-),score=86.29 TRINITY_DN2843_c0_g1_i2:50-1459(-)
MMVMPEVNGVVLDFYSLKIEVEKAGGFRAVDKKDKWDTIAKSLRLVAPSNPDSIRKFVLLTLRNHYLQHLHPYLVPDDPINKPFLIPPSTSEGKQTKKGTSQSDCATVSCTTKDCGAVLRHRIGAKRIQCPRCKGKMNVSASQASTKPLPRSTKRQPPTQSEPPIKRAKRDSSKSDSNESSIRRNQRTVETKPSTAPKPTRTSSRRGGSPVSSVYPFSSKSYKVNKDTSNKSSPTKSTKTSPSKGATKVVKCLGCKVGLKCPARATSIRCPRCSTQVKLKNISPKGSQVVKRARPAPSHEVKKPPAKRIKLESTSPSGNSAVNEEITDSSPSAEQIKQEPSSPSANSVRKEEVTDSSEEPVWKQVRSRSFHRGKPPPVFTSHRLCIYPISRSDLAESSDSHTGSKTFPGKGGMMSSAPQTDVRLQFRMLFYELRCPCPSPNPTHPPPPQLPPTQPPTPPPCVYSPSSQY